MNLIASYNPHPQAVYSKYALEPRKTGIPESIFVIDSGLSFTDSQHDHKRHGLMLVTRLLSTSELY